MVDGQEHDPVTGRVSDAGVAAADPVGRVHSWEIVTAVDGPGTRFVTWLSGCPLRCLYCHNPDTWVRADGTATRLSEHLRRLDRYARFVRVAGGGVTVSGGEPLTQAGFVAAFFRAAKERGLHTALDTCGDPGWRASEQLLDDCDLVLLDVKSSDPETYRRVTSRDLAPTLAFADRLAARGTPVWVRFVLVPGLTDDPANVTGVARVAASLGCVERVEVLPYHDTGRSKWTRLGLDYPLGDTPAPTPEQVEDARAAFRREGLQVV